MNTGSEVFPVISLFPHNDILNSPRSSGVIMRTTKKTQFPVKVVVMTTDPIHNTTIEGMMLTGRLMEGKPVNLDMMKTDKPQIKGEDRIRDKAAKTLMVEKTLHTAQHVSIPTTLTNVTSPVWMTQDRKQVEGENTSMEEMTQERRRMVGEVIMNARMTSLMRTHIKRVMGTAK